MGRAQRLIRDVSLPVEAAEAFAWHERPGAFERLTPPFLPAEVVERYGGLRPGGRVVLRAGVGPAKLRWVAEHTFYDPPREFRDVQRGGPFARWQHHHRFTAGSHGTSTLTDDVTYALPYGALGDAVAGRAVRRRLERMFDYRHAQTVADLDMHARMRGSRRMHIAVTGSTGQLGSALIAFLTTGGHTVTRLVRSQPEGPDEVRWDPAGGRLDPVVLRGVDAVVHLAGESINSGRWTAAQRRRIRDSRVFGTTLLARTLAGMDDGPRVLVSGSAIGYYGDRGDEPLTEDSRRGEGFLADVVQAWEAAAEPARAAGVRVVHTRVGLVLDPGGGALRRLLPFFRMGVGGRLGSGRQWWSWVARDDVVGVLAHALFSPGLSGAVNAVAPEPVTNAEFSRVLGSVLRRPAVVPVPAFGPRLVYGQMADELIFASARVLPTRLQADGYAFRLPGLEGALRHLLGRPPT